MILEGVALCDGEPHPLTPGDAVLVEDADGPVVLTAQTRLTLRHSPYQLSSALWQPEALAGRLERKDPQTTLHMARVRQLALALGRTLSLSSCELERLDSGAYLHDIGKLAVPTSILLKPRSLSIGEWRGVVKHTLYGREMLARTRLAAVAHIAEEHHERLDGSGYPYGLSGDEVRAESYIVAVADSFDAMTHRRPYGRTKGLQGALSELNRYAGVLYPSELVSALNAVVSGQFVCSSAGE